MRFVNVDISDAIPTSTSIPWPPTIEGNPGLVTLLY